jgi:acyl transferase domain-containing protein/acyl carrier protein
MEARGLRPLAPDAALARLAAHLATPGAIAVADVVAAPAVDRTHWTPRRIRAHVLDRARHVLGLPADVALETGRPLVELGADSIMAVELRDTLARDLAIPLPATLIFDHPTLDAVIAHLVAELAPTADAPTTPQSIARRDEPIAVIGLGCRFPGAADPRALWTLVATATDAITEVPPDRWDVDAWYDPDPDAPGKMDTRWGGFLGGIDRFEPGFFGIGAAEARSLDPQQRLLLEVGWEALEDAALAADRLVGSRTGVFMGVGASNYANQQIARGDLDAVGPHAATGTVASAAVGRISYTLGLQGPNLGLDTACSSSLVAIHLACQSLRAGESDLALAGGVNVILAPEVSLMVAKARMLAADGRCKAFDAGADGYVRSEGCGVVVLKRLSDALRDGDDIRAIVRGSAVNQDGRSSGLTAPSGPAQQAVVRAALAQAALAPTDIDFVETHGTGTSLGDPIEVQALAAVLGAGRDPARPLRLGAIKSNIGHAELAAGVAGFAKAVLALEHAQIPPNLHLRTPNPHVPWSALPVALPTSLEPWPASDRPRRAGVSSFGFSGTNAHVVLEAAPARAPAAGEGEPQLFVLSARSEDALRELAARWADALAIPGASLADACATAALGRARFAHRLAAVASSAMSLAADLRAFARGHRPFAAGRAQSPRLAFADADTERRLAAHGIAADVTADDPTATMVVDGQGELLATLGALFVHGADPTWPLTGARRGGWPVYAWQRTRHWLDAGSSSSSSSSAPATGLFALRSSPGSERVFDARITPAATPAAYALTLHDVAVAPMALWLDAALATGAASIEGLTALAPLALAPDGHALSAVTAADGAWTVAAADGDGWRAHARATWRAAAVAGGSVDVAATRERLGGAPRPGDAIHAALAAAGIDHAPPLRALAQVWTSPDGDEALAELVPGAARLAALEAGFALAGPRYPASIAAAAGDAAAIRYIHATGLAGAAELRYLDEGGRVTLRASGVALAPVDAAALVTAAHVPLEHALLGVDWLPALPSLGALPSGTWLVLADAAGTAARLAARLGDAILVAADADDVAIAAAVDRITGPLAGVVHARALDAATDAPLADLRHSAGSFLHLLQALASRRTAAPLLVLTRNADTDPRARALVALVQTAANEHPELRPVALDLDPETPDDAILDELCAAGDEPRVAWRAGRRQVARLAPRPAPAPRPLPIRADAAYLITGGTGGLGLAIARGLATRGARHLVLAARRGLPAARAAAVDALRRTGVDVQVVALDVADPAAVDHLIASLSRPLAGIVHAAGVLRDGLLANQRWDAFEAVLAPKVAGALALARHAARVDFLVLFSSVAGWLGTAGQGNYAAANAYLDALAAAHPNLRSIAWGAWAGEGMAADQGERAARQAAERGLRTIDPDEGVALFARLAVAPPAELAVVPAHWRRFARTGDLPRVLARLADAPATAPRGDLRRALAAAPLVRRPALLLAHLAEGLRTALGSDEPIEPTRGFADLGLDSLAALDTRRRLEAALDLSLPATLLLDYPTLATLRDFLLATLAPAVPPTAPVAAVPPTAPPAPSDDALADEIAALDDAEVLARIARKYDRWLG